MLGIMPHSEALEVVDNLKGHHPTWEGCAPARPPHGLHQTRRDRDPLVLPLHDPDG